MSLKTKMPRLSFVRKEAKVKGKSKNKMVVLKKKQIAAASFVALVAIAGYLNWNFSEDLVDESVSVMYNEASKKIGQAQMVAKNEKIDENDKTSEENVDEEETKMGEKLTGSNNYFAQAKIDREIKRDETVEILNDVINATESSAEAVSKAENELLSVAGYTQKEVNAENMIKSRGYSDAIVFMTENGVSVAVETEGLTEADSAVISDIVADACEKSVSCINIVEVLPEN